MQSDIRIYYNTGSTIFLLENELSSYGDLDFDFYYSLINIISRKEDDSYYYIGKN